MISKEDLQLANEYAAKLCLEAGESEGAKEQFIKRISEREEIMEEFVYYAKNNDFLCNFNVKGLTVADIVVWQIDRFKAAIDEGRFELKFNGPHMVLSAFYTMVDVSLNPERYLNRFRSETGSDYPGKEACYDKQN